ncbi:MAG: methionine--tRNA ligase subunit beta [Planctomycetes bacterium]|nr:methionine--tRNA ligase subunit beta [Planctomycetota bacterium]
MYPFRTQGMDLSVRLDAGPPGRYTPSAATLGRIAWEPSIMSEQPSTTTIQFDDFAKVQLRVAKVLEAYDHPKADKLIVLKIDLGTEQRQICAGLRGHYRAEQLVGRSIVVVANLAPRMMRGVESNGMLLAASTPDHSRVILLAPDADVPAGSAVT